jgi:hypothetical protein
VTMLSSAPNVVLIGILGSFWILWWCCAVWAKRSWIPVIPFVPLVLFGLGVLLNSVADWLGTLITAGVHVYFLARLAVAIFRTPNEQHPK